MIEDTIKNLVREFYLLQPSSMPEDLRIQKAVDSAKISLTYLKHLHHEDSEFALNLLESIYGKR
jgi:hypothetical protein